MRNHIILGLLLVGAMPPLLGAQAPAPAPQQQSPPATTSQPAQSSGAPDGSGKPSLTTLTGCVARSEADDRFVLSDASNGKYELKGNNLKSYVGKRVEVSGTSSRLKIVGGLWPSPNIAAQAGADPVQAATAAMPGGAAHGTGVEPLPELRIKTMRTIKGNCP